MIQDLLSRASAYRNLSPLLTKAFEHLSGFDPKTPDGRHVLQGDDLFLLVQQYPTSPPAERTYESHLRYIDIQYIIGGSEIIFCTPIGGLTVRAPYDEKKDVIFYDDAEGQPLTLRAGDFALFWPWDGHKPGCRAAGDDWVRKVVAKVRVPAA